MCWKEQCCSCGKATWNGCGAHVQGVMRGIKEEGRCPNWKQGAKKPCGPDNGLGSSGGGCVVS